MKRGLSIGALLVALCSNALAQGLYFVDATRDAGIDLVNTSGTDQRYIVEGMMGGAAFFDYDNDGDVDLYIANGSSFDGFPPGQQPRNALYRNEGDGTFTEVALQAAVGDTSWSMGCAVADYDNDGDADLYVSNYGRNTLYRNRADGTFDDVTKAAGVGNMGWGTGVTFGDYDRDGYVDLYVANYVDFSLDYESPIPCLWKNVGVYCGPVGLPAAADVLYRNRGDGTFVDVTKDAGLARESFYGMSAFWGDYDADGWPDLFVADDSTPNKLYHNQQDGTFVESALLAGVAYSGEGVEQGCMGAAFADYDGDGHFDIFVTNFADEANALYRGETGGFFTDVAFSSGVGTADRRLVAWGTDFFDADNDGDLDLFVANGHTYPQADLPLLNSSYEQPNSLFENRSGQFVEVTQEAGPGMALRGVSRGASFADYDADGDVDIFVLNLNALPSLLRNDSAAGRHVRMQLEGTVSNRDGIGARVSLRAGGREQHAEVQSGGSYLSHSDMRTHFGLGTADRIDWLRVRWPSGQVQEWTDVAVGELIVVREEGDAAGEIIRAR